MSPALRLRILVRRFRRPACETVPCPACREAGRGLTERTAWHTARRRVTGVASWARRPRRFDRVVRRFPGHHWVRPFVTWAGKTERGHGWLYGCVRRDAWVIGPLGFGLMRMPYDRHRPAHLRDGAR